MSGSRVVTGPDWPATPHEARALQERLRERVVTEDRFDGVRVIAGLDAHYAPCQGLVWGAAAAMILPNLWLQESALAAVPMTFPYIPGLLSFREAPALLAALGLLSLRPDLLLVDGQGLAHPRRFGLACHVGVLADLPAIGVAKSRLIGSYEDPAPERGSSAPLVVQGDVVGRVVRTRTRTRPLFVSTGHRLCLETAVNWVLRCVGRYRLPEPIRAADRLSRMHPRG